MATVTSCEDREPAGRTDDGQEGEGEGCGVECWGGVPVGVSDRDHDADNGSTREKIGLCLDFRRFFSEALSSCSSVRLYEERHAAGLAQEEADAGDVYRQAPRLTWLRAREGQVSICTYGYTMYFYFFSEKRVLGLVLGSMRFLAHVLKTDTLAS